MNEIKFVKYHTDGKYIRMDLIEKVDSKGRGHCGNYITLFDGNRLSGDMEPEKIITQIHTLYV